jgi:hypothetical protein
MANEQNLIKNEDLTPEQRRKNASKAGKASAKKRQQNKTFKEIINKFLDGQVSDERLKQQMIEFGFADKEVSNKSCAVFALWKEAIKGNTKAFELMRDTIGEKPIEQIQNINPPVINIERPKND